MIRSIVLSVYSIFFFQVAFSQVSLNIVPLDSNINPSSFSFTVTGHIYGDGTNKSGYPASTFLGNMDFIEDSLQSGFVLLTGDVFSDIKNDYAFYKKSVFSKMDIPLYNAVGNHDISGSFYQENIGETYYSFIIGNNVFILLDAETDDSQIIGDQMIFFEQELANAKALGLKNIFITSHRPIWAESNPVFQGLFSDNTRSTFGDNYLDDVYPLLSIYQEEMSIYWFSGSMGNVPVSFFYHKEEDKNITFIQTAIRNIKRDAILEVDLKRDVVSFKTHSLTGQELENLEYYNMDFWKAYKKPVVEFNYRLVPLYIKLTLTNRYFWYGMGAMLLVFFFGGLFLKRIKRMN